MTDEPIRVRRDIYFGDEGMRRLLRLVETTGSDAAEIVRAALILYELQHSLLRDQVRDAVLSLALALLPDERNDPAVDDRREQAERFLAELLDSTYAAQGIAEALNLLLHSDNEERWNISPKRGNSD